MAIDSLTERQSAVMLSIPFRLSMPIPDGTVGISDRWQLAYYFFGDDWIGAVPPVYPVQMVRPVSPNRPV